MLKVVVIGAKGRMGSRIVRLVEEASDLELSAALDAGDPIAEAIGGADVVIDFTVAEAAAENATTCARLGVPIVTGTTGLAKEQEDAVRGAAKRVPIVHSPNMSIGVNVMFELIRTAARALGTAYTIDIEETHHAHKLDRPSGTARRMAEIARRDAGDEISINSIRRGEVVGDHTIRFSGPNEELAISHRAKDRGLFAQGAVAAARWIVGKPAGLYDMSAVLGLKE